MKKIKWLLFAFLLIPLISNTSVASDSTYLYAYTNNTISMDTANVWYNITFDTEDYDEKSGILHFYNDSTNDTFTIQKTGVYYMEYVLDFKETSDNPHTNIVYRVVRNGEELRGSVYEIDLDKKDADRICVGSVTAFLYAGDKIKVQAISDSSTALLSTDCTFGDFCNTGSIFIYMVEGKGGVTMGFEYVATYIFLMLVGFGSLYLGFKREAVAWHFIATILFIVSTIYSMTIPFVTNASGEVIGSPANIVLSGVALIFVVIGLLFSFKQATDLFQ